MIMPLLDHFHPPLSLRRHWDSFHGAWAEAMAGHFNQALLPERYYAEARVTLGKRVEIDVATFDEQQPPEGKSGGVAVWAPPRPVARVPLDFSPLDVFEVQVLNDEEGPRLVAAIELVSPANKDRPSNRRAFAIKCASYLEQGVCVMIVDVVTERRANLHAELLRLLKVQAETPAKAPRDLYATAYRTVTRKETLHLEIWAKKLAIGAVLPTLPLWISPEDSIPVDLEETYQAARVARRIA
jgi:hypothetical protein